MSLKVGDVVWFDGWVLPVVLGRGRGEAEYSFRDHRGGVYDFELSAVGETCFNGVRLMGFLHAKNPIRVHGVALKNVVECDFEGMMRWAWEETHRYPEESTGGLEDRMVTRFGWLSVYRYHEWLRASFV